MNDRVMEFDRLSKSFGRQQVLRNISASVARGEVIGLLGLNGAGKTTLLETALGFSPPGSGTCRVFGDADPLHMEAGTKARIGFVPQQDDLLEAVSGRIYLEMVASFYPGWNHALIKRLSTEWQVPLESRISTLSVGQRQKLAILGALGHEPELVVLDEPVASLDPRARRQFLRELVEIASDHRRTIIFSTHIVTDLERIASRVWVMKDGRIAIDEPLDELKERSARDNMSLEDIFLEMHA